MMSKKYYELIAEVCRTARQTANEKNMTADLAISELSNMLAHAFWVDNPNFDVRRFLDAAGEEE